MGELGLGQIVEMSDEGVEFGPEAGAAVGRVDNVYGDRNPVCSCVGMEAYAKSAQA